MADMDQQEMTDALREEIEGLTSTDRAAVLLLLLGEQEAAKQPCRRFAPRPKAYSPKSPFN